RQQIVIQFLVESVLLTLIALLGTTFIFTIVRDQFTSMVYGAETLDLGLSLTMIIWFVIFGLLVGIGAGLFPALYFSKIRPLGALKSSSSSGSISISTIRKSLIVVQFVISLVFIIGVSVIAKQHQDMLSYHLGFDQDNILTVPLKGLDGGLITQEFSNVAGVKEVSLSSNMPGMETGLLRTYIRSSNNFEDSMRVHEMYIDDQFLSSLGFEMVWGENLNYASSINEPILVNETFMQRNKIINEGQDSLLMNIGEQRAHIAGVLKDFNFMQLNMTITPMIVRYAPERARYALLKVDVQNIISTIDQLEAKWDQIDQEKSFESYFLDHQIEASYQSAFSIIKVVGFLGLLSITISCIGLLGMIVYFTESHIKEVALRKIMGASLLDLYRVLGSSFMKLLAIATIIATPPAYLFYDQVFVKMISKYSVGVGWLEVAASVGFMFILGGLPILWMVTRLSNVNPATNLRYE
ncbi:MAG: FtsX-like permease family protein, partial [Bacteroidota bacterium]